MEAFKSSASSSAASSATALSSVAASSVVPSSATSYLTARLAVSKATSVSTSSLKPAAVQKRSGGSGDSQQIVQQRVRKQDTDRADNAMQRIITKLGEDAVEQTKSDWAVQLTKMKRRLKHANAGAEPWLLKAKR